MNVIPSFAALTESFKAMMGKRDSDIVAQNFVSLYLTSWEFDEEWYLSEYPDLAAAIPSQFFPTAFTHFVAVGYMEGRMPVKPKVDSGWYLATYPDVATAIIRGAFENAEHHYLTAGYSDGRLPAAPEIDVAWYRHTYLQGQSPDADCEDHFVAVGYLTGALPRPRNS